jgi:hypothetical protein
MWDGAADGWPRLFVMSLMVFISSPYCLNHGANVSTPPSLVSTVIETSGRFKLAIVRIRKVVTGNRSYIDGFLVSFASYRIDSETHDRATRPLGETKFNLSRAGSPACLKESSMRLKLAAVLAISLYTAWVAYGQAPASSAAPTAAPAEQAQIEKLLWNYQTAYSSSDYNGILKLWPTLPANKQANSKLKSRLARKDIKDTKLAVKIETMDKTATGAVLHCKQLETYTIVYDEYNSMFDGNRDRMPQQDPGPNRATVSRPERKLNDVWITVQNTETGLVILSMTNKNPR